MNIKTCHYLKSVLVLTIYILLVDGRVDGKNWDAEKLGHIPNWDVSRFSVPVFPGALAPQSSAKKAGEADKGRGGEYLRISGTEIRQILETGKYPDGKPIYDAKKYGSWDKLTDAQKIAAKMRRGSFTMNRSSGRLNGFSSIRMLRGGPCKRGCRLPKIFITCIFKIV